LGLGGLCGGVGGSLGGGVGGGILCRGVISRGLFVAGDEKEGDGQQESCRDQSKQANVFHIKTLSFGYLVLTGSL
jgi:hypothetical protein